MNKVIYLRPPKLVTLEPKECVACAHEIVLALAAVRNTLHRIKQGSSRNHEIHVLSSDLLHLLALCQREPEMEHSVDELYEAARLFVLRAKPKGASDTKCVQRLNQAHRNLTAAFATAQPRK